MTSGLTNPFGSTAKLNAVAAGLDFLPIEAMATLCIASAGDMNQVIDGTSIQDLAGYLADVF